MNMCPKTGAGSRSRWRGRRGRRGRRGGRGGRAAGGAGAARVPAARAPAPVRARVAAHVHAAAGREAAVPAAPSGLVYQPY